MLATAKLAEECVVGACWRQWRALQGTVPVSAPSARSIIDPEGLVLASLSMRHRERRLQDLLLWWATKGATLMSVQRLRTMMAAFSPSVHRDVQWFATLALASGDRRWTGLAQGSPLDESARPRKGPRELRLLEPSTLMLRLRAGFGVGAKADLLAFLIGAGSPLREHDYWTTAAVISGAISYSRVSVRRAIGDMVLAGLVEMSADRPPTYCVDARSWAGALGLRSSAPTPSGSDFGHATQSFEVPPWRFLGQIYAFLCACGPWAEDARKDDMPPEVLASRARDIVERFERVFAWGRVASIDAHLHPGEQFLDAFRKLVVDVTAWVDRNV